MGRAYVDAEPRTFKALGDHLLTRWPDRDRFALEQQVRTTVPLIQVPPRGLWGRSGPIAHTSIEAWLGAPPADRPDLDTLVLRYLRAFGPAGVMDIQAWCGLTRLSEVVDRLRPGLVTFRDDAGRELFDLPDAPRPDPGHARSTALPVRLREHAAVVRGSHPRDLGRGRPRGRAGHPGIDQQLHDRRVRGGDVARGARARPGRGRSRRFGR